MPYSHEVEIFVRLCETDAIGHVNNTSHFRYFEEARGKFFNVIYPDRSSSFNLIIASIKCDYKQQAFAGQILTVITNIERIGNKSFTVTQLLKSKDSQAIIAKSELVLVCYDNLKGISIPIPEQLRKNLEIQLSYN
ncbi:acyl-CoA thioesterase [Oceanobacillus halophilus]|uniref:Acyl-CoA thioesterase n=1 Tax=Oceanobacillus halophilus TaxID=930130 RepID=A0A495A7H0_9BACI|nr:thioesterase family protein [Oceanobacillus halophilus]RKQ35740.1 acyl-CoA thioesterase [Oceanobacillus halophilus]